jgi:hypothetical protein
MSENSGPADSEPSAGESLSKSNTPTARATVLGVVVALAGLLVTLGQLVAPSGTLEAIFVACVILAAIGFVVNVTLGKTKQSIAIGAGVLLAVSAASCGIAGTKALQHVPLLPVSSPSTLPKLSMTLYKNQRMRWCVTLHGSGHVPAGYSLLIFNREVDMNDQAGQDARYSEVGQADSLGGTWSLSQAHIGVRRPLRHFHVELTGVLVDDRTAAFVAAIDSPRGWSTPTLPPAIESIHAFVLRTTNLASCS